MIRTDHKTIGGLEFEVSQLPYFRAQRLFARLLRLAGPGLTALATLAGASGGKAALSSLGDLSIDRLVPVLAAFFEKLDPDDVEKLTREILATTRVHHEGQLIDLLRHMDVIIGGDFWTGLSLQAFALSVHFGNFNSARDALAALGLKVKASTSSGSTISTGSPASS